MAAAMGKRVERMKTPEGVGREKKEKAADFPLERTPLPGVAPGEAILDVDVTRARSYQFSAFAHNYRPTSIGSESVGVTVLMHSLTGQSDVLEASLPSPAQFGQGTGSALAWQIPSGFAGTRMNLAQKRGSSSVVDSNELGLSQLVFQSQRHPQVHYRNEPCQSQQPILAAG